MADNYNQIRAMLAITKGSLKATFRSPSAVLFSIGFPLIFILVFGFIGGGGGYSLNVAMDKNSDTTNMVYNILKGIPNLKFKTKSKSDVLNLKNFKFWICLAFRV